MSSTAPTGPGKTNLLEAVHFALTGHGCRGGRGSRSDRSRRRGGPGRAGARRARGPPDDPFLARSRRQQTASSSTALLRHRLLRRPRARRWASSCPTACSWSRARRPIAAPTSTGSWRRCGPRALTCELASAGPSPSAMRWWGGSRAALRRGRHSPAWDEKLAAEAVPLIESRSEALAALGGHFAAAATDLGLGEATVRYRPRVEADRRAVARGARPAPRTGPRPGLPQLRSPTGRDRVRTAPAARFGASAPRASSGWLYWHCCSPSARA